MKTEFSERAPHAENVPIPRNSSAIIARAAAGLNMTVSEYLNKTFGDVLPEGEEKKAS